MLDCASISSGATGCGSSSAFIVTGLINSAGGEKPSGGRN